MPGTLRAMVRRLGVALTAATLPMSMTVAPANAQEEDINAQVMSTPSGRVTLPFDYSRPIERFMVKFNHFTGRTDTDRINTVKEAARQNGTEAEFVEQGLGGVVLFELNPPIPPEKSLSMVATLESKAEIVYSEPDYYQQELATPNDPLFKHQWALQEYGKPQNPTRSSHGINAVGAWDLGYKGEGVNIAIVDSGITDHPDLNRKVLPGYDFISDPVAAGDGNGRDQDPSDMGSGTGGKPSSWHGTHVAGVAAADTDNGIGVAGVAPDAKILPIRAMGRGGGTTYDITQGILWAAGVSGIDNVPANPNPAKVINLSLGAKNRCNPLYQDSINLALAHGATLVVAAGNSNVPASTFSPASCDGVITVGATGPYGKRAYYSNYDRDGSNVIAVAAPGGAYDQLIVDSPVDGYEMILSTVNSGKTFPLGPAYDQQQGTSQAAPAVSGVIAMMRHANPDLLTPEIKSILQSTSKPFTKVDVGQNIGTGIIDAYAAVCEAIRRNPDITEGPCAKDATVSPTTSPSKPSSSSTSASTPVTAPTTTVTTTTTSVTPSTTTTTATSRVNTTSTATETTTATSTATSTSTRTVTATVTSTAAAPTVTRTVTSTAPTPTIVLPETTTKQVTDTETATATATSTTVIPKSVTATPTVTENVTATVTPAPATEVTTRTVTPTPDATTETHVETVAATAKTTTAKPSVITESTTETPEATTVTQKLSTVKTVTPNPSIVTTTPAKTHLTTTVTEIPETSTSTPPGVTITEETVTTTVLEDAVVTVTTTPEPVTSYATATKTVTEHAVVTTTTTHVVGEDGEALPAVTELATVTAKPTVTVTSTVLETPALPAAATSEPQSTTTSQLVPVTKAEAGSSDLSDRCTTALAATGIPLLLLIPAGIAATIGLPGMSNIGSLGATLPSPLGLSQQDRDRLNKLASDVAAPAAAIIIGLTVVGLVVNACLSEEASMSSSGSSR